MCSAIGTARNSTASDQPVSRQYELQYHDYYGWPYYGYGSYMWGGSPGIIRAPEAWKKIDRREKAWDPNLCSTSSVTGHHIQALDGEIGHVEDFIIDEKTWSIRYLVVDTKNWWTGKHIVISPQWIKRISWPESMVFVNLSREIIRRSRAYTPDSLNRGYEIELHQHYGRNGYWAEEPADHKESAAVLSGPNAPAGIHARCPEDPTQSPDTHSSQSRYSTCGCTFTFDTGC